MIETTKALDQKSILQQAENKGWLEKKNYQVITISPLIKQQLSHQLITGQFIKIKLNHKPELENDWLWTTKNKIGKYAFPRIINQYLKSGINA
jgi:A/G-specific adenine glycosylase